jgi:pathogenesis-related protein 1
MKTIATCATAVLAAVFALVGIAGTAFADTSTSDADAILALHNQYRAEVGTAPLQWDTTLQASAQQYADQLLASGKRDHDPNRGPVGENLYWDASNGTRQPAATLNATSAPISWYTEKTVLGGHYTQMVWKDTTNVGCGVATRSETQGDTQVNTQVVVCRYSPAGNTGGPAF